MKAGRTAASRALRKIQHPEPTEVPGAEDSGAATNGTCFTSMDEKIAVVAHFTSMDEKIAVVAHVAQAQDVVPGRTSRVLLDAGIADLEPARSEPPVAGEPIAYRTAHMQPQIKVAERLHKKAALAGLGGTTCGGRPSDQPAQSAWRPRGLRGFLLRRHLAQMPLMNMRCSTTSKSYSRPTASRMRSNSSD